MSVCSIAKKATILTSNSYITCYLGNITVEERYEQHSYMLSRSRVISSNIGGVNMITANGCKLGTNWLLLVIKLSS